MKLTRTTPRRSVALLTLEGRLTMDGGCSMLHEAITALVKEPDVSTVLLDMHDVSYADSSGIGELVSSYTITYNAGRHHALVALSPRVDDVLTLTKLRSVFTIYTTLDDALRASPHG